MSLDTSFGTNETYENDGVWFDYGDKIGKFLLARAGGSNKRFAKTKERLMRSIRRRMSAGASVTEDEQRKVLINIYAEAVVLDWTGVKEFGEELAYNRENVVHVLTAYPDLFENYILTDAPSMEHFLLEIDSKN